ncbi:MAG: glycosyltransferase family 4 protein [Candidatus Eisenbacteria bacterium]|nr:glycosyltransferase family 4 protein [Candidatus Eisenbacteria bacterium]
MKVLIAHDIFAPDFRGGGEVVVLETARHLQRRGAQVRVLCTGDPALAEYEGIVTRRLPIHRYRYNLADREFDEEARRADIIQSFNYHACLPSLRAARRAGIPVVCQMLGICGDSWLDIQGPLMGRAWRAWERHLVRQPYTRTAFLSDFSLQEGLQLGVDPSRAIVTNPGLDLELYDPAREKEDVVLFVGKIDVRKGVQNVLDAARALPEVRFRLVGWGAVEEFRRGAPGNAEFVGLVRGAALRDEFARARIFLLPSRGETFGIALVEAMASGCAVVSSIPLPFAGERIAYGDSAAITAAVRRLWNDRDESRRVGLRNVAMASQYTWDRYTTTLLDTYEELLARPG